jgi:hypothetical protein
MAYTVSNTDGSRTITVADGTFDTSTYSVTLVGKNVTNYGDVFVKNSIRHLENFASATAPSVASPLVGQVWYDKNGKVLRVYKSASEGWVRVSPVVAETAPTDGLSDGTMYFDTSDNKLKVYSGATWNDASYAGTVTDEYSAVSSLGTPSAYGSRSRTIFLKDQSGVARAVHALTYVNNSETDDEHPNGETIMAIFSDHTEFVVSDVVSQTDDDTSTFNWYDQITASDGFKGSDGTSGGIKKGFNLRNEYANTSIALADRAIEADSVTGNLKIGSTYYPISSIVLTSSDIVPDAGDTFDLGSSTARWMDLHINGTAYLGQSGGSAVIRPAANALLYVGQSTNKVHQVHATQANVDNATFGDVYVTSDLNVTGNIVATSISADITFDDFTSADATISNVLTATNGIASLGYLTTTGYANIGSTLTVVGQTNLNGSVRVGDSDADGVEFVADIISGMRPNADSSFDIGADAYRWRQIFVDTAVITDGANVGGRARITNSDDADSYNDYQVSFRTDGGAVVRKNLYVNQNVNVTSTVTGATLTDGTLNINSGAITGGTTGSFSGQMSVGSLNSSGAVSGTTGTFTGDVSLGDAVGDDISINGKVDTDILPKTTTSHNLGSSTLKWSNVYATTFNGTATAAQYADLAEIYEADADYEPGTLVKIGGPKEITIVDKEYDGDVFGIISTNPAYLMNSEAQGLPVALTGRVPCKVDGIIKKGERLVSSGTPGVACRLGNREYDPRKVIGRALQGKDTLGSGVIEVIVGVK